MLDGSFFFWFHPLFRVFVQDRNFRCSYIFDLPKKNPLQKPLQFISRLGYLYYKIMKNSKLEWTCQVAT